MELGGAAQGIYLERMRTSLVWREAGMAELFGLLYSNPSPREKLNPKLNAELLSALKPHLSRYRGGALV